MKKLENIAVEKSSEELAIFTHGILFGLHSLGIYYNLRRGKLKSALVHGGIAIFDMASLYNHARNVYDSEFVERLRERGL